VLRPELALATLLAITPVLLVFPLLEPPGWALAERELFDLLDYAWRRFAGDFTGPDGRLNYRHTLTSRDGGG